MLFKGKRRIYLDYAAATPVRHEVARAMRAHFSDSFGNPSAIHEEGRAARGATEAARSLVARTLRVKPEEILFTSGGTESNALAITGVIEKFRAEGRAYADMEILAPAIEHPSITETLAHFSTRGVVVRDVPLTTDGLIDTNALTTLIFAKTVLIVFAYANSEVGVVQDVKKVTRMVRQWREEHGTALPHVLLDASQAPLYLPCALDSLGVDLMTLDAGKCYGPKGIGVLVRRRYVGMLPHTHGGGQESGLRPGTENVPLVVGCATALKIAQEGHERRATLVGALRDHLIEMLMREIPGTLLNGSASSRVANNVNISIPGLDGEFAVVTLDVKGVAASTRSACGAGKEGGSHVVLHLTGDAMRASGTMRFTLGEETKKRDLDRVVSILKRHVVSVRERQ